MMNMTDHLLVLLAEECAEVQHAIAKALRFGLDHKWPEKEKTNRDQITLEVNDVITIASILRARGDIDIAPDNEAKSAKLARMIRLSADLGRVEPADSLIARSADNGSPQ